MVYVTIAGELFYCGRTDIKQSLQTYAVLYLRNCYVAALLPQDSDLPRLMDRISSNSGVYGSAILRVSLYFLPFAKFTQFINLLILQNRRIFYFSRAHCS
jgi:hypothetical protein